MTDSHLHNKLSACLQDYEYKNHTCSGCSDVFTICSKIKMLFNSHLSDGSGVSYKPDQLIFHLTPTLKQDRHAE